MIRNYQVRIHKHIYNIDEDAYDILQNHYQKINYLNIDEKIKQVLYYEIDQYIDQILQKYSHYSTTPIITRQIIEEVVYELFSSDELVKSKIKKSFYRYKQKKIILGVCSGLAAYYKVPVNVVRTLFVLLFFVGGLSLLVYILIFLNTKSSNSTIDILRLHGEPITLNNIVRILSTNQQFYTNTKLPSIYIDQVLVSDKFKKIFTRIIHYIFGAGLIFIFTFFLTFMFYFFFSYPINNPILQFIQAIYPSIFISNFIKFFFLLLFGSFVFLILHFILNFFKITTHIRIFKNFGKILFIVSSFMIVGILFYTLFQFSENERITNNHSLAKTKTIEFDLLQNHADSNLSWPYLSFLQKPQVIFNSSSSDTTFIKIIKEAHGKYKIEAIEYCNAISFHYNVQQRKIELSPYWYTKEKKYRLQRVIIVIQIPQNVFIKVSNKFLEHFFNIKNLPNNTIEFTYNLETFRKFLLSKK